MQTCLQLCMCVCASVTVPLLAHHAFSSEFDANKPVKLKGVVSRIEWINPHTWIHVDVKETDGKVTKWMIEGGSPNALIRRGVTSQLLKVGMEVMVDGYQAKGWIAARERAGYYLGGRAEASVEFAGDWGAGAVIVGSVPVSGSLDRCIGHGHGTLTFDS